MTRAHRDTGRVRRRCRCADRRGAASRPLPSRLAVGELAWAAVGAASLAAAEIAGARRSPRPRPDRPRVCQRAIREARRSGADRVRSAVGLLPHGRRMGPHARQLSAPCARTAGGSRAGGGRGRAGCGIRPRIDGGGRSIPRHHEPGRGVLGGPPRAARGGRRAAPRAARARGAKGAAPRGALPLTGAPLAGVRVLDLTRVIAGPVATRTLALFGADVLRVDPPGIPEIRWQHLDTGHGKRSTLLDLAAHGRRARFDALVETADVVVLGYRPGGLARLRALAGGAGRTASVDRRRAALRVGNPDQRGFDSIVQAASGISWIESRDAAAPAPFPRRRSTTVPAICSRPP